MLGQRLNDVAIDLVPPLEEIIHQLIVFIEEQTGLRKAQPFDIFLSGLSWIDFLQVPRYAACDQQDRQLLVNTDACAPHAEEKQGIPEGQLIQCRIPGNSAEVAGMTRKLIVDPPGQRAAQDQDEIAQPAEFRLPQRPQLAAEFPVGVSNPVDLIQYQNSVAAFDPVGEMPQQFVPIVRRRFRNLKDA